MKQRYIPPEKQHRLVLEFTDKGTTCVYKFHQTAEGLKALRRLVKLLKEQGVKV